MAEPQPFSVWHAQVVSRDPIVLRPAEHCSDHATENAARTRAKSVLDGGLWRGPRNVTEVRAGDRVLERWIMGDSAAYRGSTIRMQVRAQRLLFAPPVSRRPAHWLTNAGRRRGPYAAAEIDREHAYWPEAERTITTYAPTWAVLAVAVEFDAAWAAVAGLPDRKAVAVAAQKGSLFGAVMQRHSGRAPDLKLEVYRRRFDTRPREVG